MATSTTALVTLPNDTPRRRNAKRLLAAIPNPLGLIPLVVALVLWQLLVESPDPYFPPPSDWVKAIVNLATKGELWPAFWATLSKFFISLAIATVLGSAIGMLVGRSRFAWKTTGPLFEFCRAIPAAAVVPIAALFGGYTANMAIFVVVFAAIWPVLLTVQRGAQEMNPARVDLGRSLRLNRWQSFSKILLPSLIPSILLGVRVGAPIVLVVVLLVEILTQIPGLGALLQLAQQTFRTAEVYGIVAVACILGVLTNVIFGLLEGASDRFDRK